MIYGQSIGCSHVELIKKEIHTLWNGMKVKELSSVHIMVLERDLWGLCNSIPQKNRFLAAGDEFLVKFWDMDNVNLLMTTDAEGGLPVLLDW